MPPFFFEMEGGKKGEKKGERRSWTCFIQEKRRLKEEEGKNGVGTNGYHSPPSSFWKRRKGEKKPGGL